VRDKPRHSWLGYLTETEFLASDLLQSAVLQKLTIIGEAALRSVFAG